MRRGGIALVSTALLLAVGLFGTLGTADARKKRTCHPPHSKSYKTSKKNKSALLFTRSETQDTLDVKALYGCHRRTKRPVRLATTGGYDPDAVFVKLQGRYVAVNYTSSDRLDQRSGFLRLWDLKRPKRLFSVADTDASDIEIGPKGQLVWIGTALTAAGSPPPSVLVVDRKGRRTLATGNIAPKSLVIRGSTVRWTQDGTAKSAQL